MSYHNDVFCWKVAFPSRCHIQDDYFHRGSETSNKLISSYSVIAQFFNYSYNGKQKMLNTMDGQIQFKLIKNAIDTQLKRKHLINNNSLT